LSGVRIDALLAGKAKYNRFAVGVVVRAGQCRVPGAQAQERSGEQIGDFLLRMPGHAGWRRD
jgi:hypothetical protein